MRVPILNLKSQYNLMQASLDEAVLSVARSQELLLGREVEAFELEVRSFLATREAIGVSSGSDALVCALLALEIGPGDEVIVPPFSFFATVESILRVGAHPRFVDIRPDTYGLDVTSVEAAIGPKTRAILLVHLYGQPAPARELSLVAQRHGVHLVEDAAQAFGARLMNAAVGTFGTLGCFSFQPTKPLGAFGDAGLIVTNDSALAERCRRLRVHGASAKHVHEEIGGNFRMDALQAAVLRVKLPYVSAWLDARRTHSAGYTRALGCRAEISPPAVSPQTESSCSLYTVRVHRNRRDELRNFLAQARVQSAVHYPLPLHRQPALTARGYGAPLGSFPEAERAAREVLSLPLYPELTNEQREYVADCIGDFYAVSENSAGWSSKS